MITAYILIFKYVCIDCKNNLLELAVEARPILEQLAAHFWWASRIVCPVGLPDTRKNTRHHSFSAKKQPFPKVEPVLFLHVPSVYFFLYSFPLFLFLSHFLLRIYLSWSGNVISSPSGSRAESRPQT